MWMGTKIYGKQLCYVHFALPSPWGSTLKGKNLLFKEQILSYKSKPLLGKVLLPLLGKVLFPREANRMKTRGPNVLILTAWVFFATIYQSPPMDGPCGNLRILSMQSPGI